jgi:hypothetical protein
VAHLASWDLQEFSWAEFQDGPSVAKTVPILLLKRLNSNLKRLCLVQGHLNASFVKADLRPEVICMVITQDIITKHSC